MTVEMDALEASLTAGHVWVAHADGPDEGDKKVGITVALRRLPQDVFQVNVDTYYLEGLYGTDISWDKHRFDTLAAALQFIEESTGIARQSLKKYRGS